MDFTYDQYMLVFYCGIVSAVLFLVLAVILLFVLKIPAVIGYLSGSTQKKAIMEIRNNNGKPIAHKNTSANRSRGKITEKMDGLSPKNGGQTEKIMPNLTTAKLKNIEPASVVSEETSVLEETSNQTSLLVDETANTSVGTVIDNDSGYVGQTTVLDNGTQVLVQASSNTNARFEIRTEITLFVSTEVIV